MKGETEMYVDQVISPKSKIMSSKVKIQIHICFTLNPVLLPHFLKFHGKEKFLLSASNLLIISSAMSNQNSNPLIEIFHNFGWISRSHTFSFSKLIVVFIILTSVLCLALLYPSEQFAYTYKDRFKFLIWVSQFNCLFCWVSKYFSNFVTFVSDLSFS